MAKLFLCIVSATSRSGRVKELLGGENSLSSCQSPAEEEVVGRLEESVCADSRVVFALYVPISTAL